MSKIQGVWTREIINSIGNPTLECTLWLDTGGIVATAVASDAKFEEKPSIFPLDSDPNHFSGSGLVLLSQVINTEIAAQIVGRDPLDQLGLDQILSNAQKRIGKGGSLAISQAILKAAALVSGLPTYGYLQQKYQLTTQLKIPTCMYTMITGGEFGTHNLDIQEFLLMAATHLPFSNSLSMASTVFGQIQKILISKKTPPSVNSLGGVTPNLYSNNDAFELLLESAKTTQYVFSQDFFFGINVMADNLYAGGKYHLRERQEGYLADELLEYYKKIQQTYQILCMQNPFVESDKKLAAAMMAELGQSTKIAGTIPVDQLHKLIAQNIYNSIIIQANHFSTITEMTMYINQLRQHGLPFIFSQSFEETNDDLIADLAVGFGADYVQFGPTNRGERVAKYNRLLMIETELKRGSN